MRGKTPSNHWALSKKKSRSWPAKSDGKRLRFGAARVSKATAAGTGPSLGVILRHDDAEREWAYDRSSPIGRLDKALDEARVNGWKIVDMKKEY